MATEDAVWSAEATTPDAIEAALRELLLEAHAHDDRVVPARVLNMIAFVDREWSGGDRQPPARRRPLPRLAHGGAGV